MDYEQILITPEEAKGFQIAKQQADAIDREAKLLTERAHAVQDFEFMKIFALKGYKITDYEIELTQEGGLLLIRKPEDADKQSA